jgi:hypothetical protein
LFRYEGYLRDAADDDSISVVNHSEYEEVEMEVEGQEGEGEYGGEYGGEKGEYEVEYGGEKEGNKAEEEKHKEREEKRTSEVEFSDQRAELDSETDTKDKKSAFITPNKLRGQLKGQSLRNSPTRSKARSTHLDATNPSLSPSSSLSIIRAEYSSLSRSESESGGGSAESKIKSKMKRDSKKAVHECYFNGSDSAVAPMRIPAALSSVGTPASTAAAAATASAADAIPVVGPLLAAVKVDIVAIVDPPVPSDIASDSSAVTVSNDMKNDVLIDDGKEGRVGMIHSDDKKELKTDEGERKAEEEDYDDGVSQSFFTEVASTSNSPTNTPPNSSSCLTLSSPSNLSPSAVPATPSSAIALSSALNATIGTSEYLDSIVDTPKVAADMAPLTPVNPLTLSSGGGSRQVASFEEDTATLSPASPSISGSVKVVITPTDESELKPTEKNKFKMHERRREVGRLSMLFFAILA